MKWENKKVRVQICEKCLKQIVIKASVKLTCLSCLFNVGHSTQYELGFFDLKLENSSSITNLNGMSSFLNVRFQSYCFEIWQNNLWF